jgi:hypothetical protein
MKIRLAELLGFVCLKVRKGSGGFRGEYLLRSVGTGWEKTRVSAGLLIQGIRRSLTVDPGYETKRVFIVSLHAGRHPSPAIQRAVINRLGSVPSVASVAIASKPPGTGTYTVPAIVEGSRGSELSLRGGALGDLVSPGYFQT